MAVNYIESPFVSTSCYGFRLLQSWLVQTGNDYTIRPNVEIRKNLPLWNSKHQLTMDSNVEDPDEAL